MRANPYYDLSKQVEFRVSQMFAKSHGEVFAWGDTIVPLPESIYAEAKFTEGGFLSGSLPEITLMAPRYGTRSWMEKHWPRELWQVTLSHSLPGLYREVILRLDGVENPIRLFLVDSVEAYRTFFNNLDPLTYWENFSRARLGSDQDAFTPGHSLISHGLFMFYAGQRESRSIDYRVQEIEVENVVVPGAPVPVMQADEIGDLI